MHCNLSIVCDYLPVQQHKFIILKQAARNSIYATITILMLAAAVDGCNQTGNPATTDLRNRVPAFVKDNVYLSPGNPFSTAKAALGRYLFYDRRLSVNQTKSCASCHDPVFSFADGYRRSIGALGDNVQHNAPALINIIFNKYLTAADSSLHFPEQQINNPMFHTRPPELGWQGNEQLLLARIKKDSLYRQQLPLLFAGESDPFSVKNLQACISSFVKSILSFNAPYDRFVFEKDTAALTAAQRRGMNLFFSDSLHCSSCHNGINFNVPFGPTGPADKDYYQNTGLYNADGRGAYPVTDQGLFETTRQAADMGRYRIPTLRNLAFTAPYFHDGSAADLDAVITVYQNGGRNISSGENRGDGRTNPYKSHLIKGFSIDSRQKRDLITFIISLSDSSICNNPLYANPFKADETRR